MPLQERYFINNNRALKHLATPVSSKRVKLRERYMKPVFRGKMEATAHALLIHFSLIGFKL